MIWDYFVVNASADTNRWLDPDKFEARLATAKAVVVGGILFKYPHALAKPVFYPRDRDGKGLTNYGPGMHVYPSMSKCIRMAVDSGLRMGVYSPAPRTDMNYAGWINYFGNLYAEGVGTICLDAQADNWHWDAEMLDQARKQGLMVWCEPYAADAERIMQECSPLRPGWGLERAYDPTHGFARNSSVTALIVDRAETREASIAYAASWLKRGCDIAFNVAGWSKQDITAQDIADAAGGGA